MALIAELSDIPALPGARCRGREKLFDAAMRHDGGRRGGSRRAARRVCAGCPCLATCAAWVEALPPSRRPVGIVGGLIVDRDGRLPADRAQRRSRLSGKTPR
jgi:hypothetical protein